MARRRCLDCGQLTDARCLTCHPPRPAPTGQPRAPGWKRYDATYRLARAHVLAAHPWCTWCATTTDLTVDHVIAKANGGTDDPSNLQVLCRSCNSQKGTS
jgi:5-methylcytosine-specific restriction enzyme A